MFDYQLMRFLLLPVAVLILACYVGELDAQRSGRLGSSGRSQQSAAIEALVRQMDTNKNGYIDPSEMKGLAKKYAERFGLDLRRSQQISKVVEAVRTKGKNPSATKKKSETNRKVPGFAVDQPERVGIADFSPSGEERMTVEMMKRKFSASVMSQVERTMSRNDKNKSGLLEADEIARSRWSNPTWQESDTNKDGKLTRLELAYRYKNREDAAKKSISVPPSTRTSSLTSNRSRYTSGRSTRSTGSTRSSGRTTSRASSPRSGGSSSNSSSNRRGFNSGNDAYKRYAEGLLKGYDKDKDGKLSKKELKEMRRPPKDADKNKDGFVDKSELIASVEERSGVKKSSSNSSADKLRRPSNKVYNQADTVFGGKDLNNDRQLQMVEFSDKWNDKVVEEFKEKDTNGDGVITEKEWKSS